jgi:hypothetical protein
MDNEPRKTFEPFYKTTRERRPEFDPAADYITVKPMLLGGDAIAVNSPFDKARVPLRRLRQLYDGRYLRMVEVEKPLEVAPKESRGHVRPQRVKMNTSAEDVVADGDDDA